MKLLFGGGHDYLDLVAGGQDLAGKGGNRLGSLSLDDVDITGVAIDTTLHIAVEYPHPVPVLLDLVVVVLDQELLEVLKRAGVDVLAGGNELIVHDLQCQVGELGLDGAVGIDAAEGIVTVNG